MDTSPAASFPVRRVTASGAEDTRDMLAVEEPLEIRLVSGEGSARSNKPVSVTMRTPGHDEELAVGFLFTEGIVTGSDEVLSVQAGADPQGNSVVVELDPKAAPALQGLERNFYTTSSCGVCGKASVDAVRVKSRYNAGDSQLKVASAMLNELQGKLRGHQKVFDVTGGLHASALFDSAGNLVMVREDVGRHNALDKLIGAALLQKKIPLSNHVLLLSGRISFELVQKASMAGIPLVAAIGAPSSLAVTLAEDGGMTLVGFLRENRYTVYCGQQRVVG
ncbi:MAG: formate dehydrogenase accessory sulfurtransferase FdhD [Cyclobacteriaceae bacterium]|nr:formate dehydrogenase accessory sulfurtransferase FdhD [Cyclobacteriaceae bacterium]